MSEPINDPKGFVQQAKHNYQHPVAVARRGENNSYSVGGAFTRAFWGDDGFTGHPTASMLADTLCLANEQIDHEDARWWAEMIVQSNEVGNFAEAWRLLEACLVFASRGHIQPTLMVRREQA